ncbi:MAG: hypothetical protein ACPKPY_07165 [Nitrososphaeraceae archaeon]
MSSISNNLDINKWADFWFYQIGVNIISADTRRKTVCENWSSWQNKYIPKELHEFRKKNGYYNKGIAIITGKIWRGPFKDKYLVAIDLDNKKAIDEFCINKKLELFKSKTLVEQHADKNKIHIYFIVDEQIPDKSSDINNIDMRSKIEDNEIPAIEVKASSKKIMFCSNSPHKNGSNYQIIGTLEPQVFEAWGIKEQISIICDKYNISYNLKRSNNNLIPIKDLFESETKILEGHNRHEALLRVMESLLQRNRGIMTLEEIKEHARKINQRLCVPPLNDIEFEKQWKHAIKFIERNHDNINENRETEDTGNNNHIIKGDTRFSNEKSVAEIITELALETCTLFKNEYEQPYVLFKINNHYDVLSIDGSKFENYLAKLYYDQNEKQIANAEAINNAIRTLRAKALFGGRTIPLHLRVAWARSDTKDFIYYDMCDEKRRYVKVTKQEGWRIVENQFDVLFKRFGHQSPQVEPLYNYDPKILDNFVDSLNIKNYKHKLLVKVWMISLLIPDIVKPMLLPFGEKGSAKSTLFRKIKMLIDPSHLDLFSITHSKEEFIQQLSHNYLCFYDNVRYEPKWLSDEVCRAITGTSHSKRKLYSDDDDIPYRYKKILGFAGINVIFKEPDALDRSIKIELERIREENNIPDSKIEQELKQQIPGLLGYIFDIVSKALAIKDSIRLDRLPRMADFAEWGEAIARALGYSPLEFINTYFENIGEQNVEIIEDDPFAYAISKFIDYERQSWISSPRIFIDHLKNYAENNNIESIKFPKNPQAVSRRLNKIKSNLREGLGIEVIVDRITAGKGNKKQMNNAIIKIRKISPVYPVSPVTQNDEENKPGNTGDIKKTGDNTYRESKIPPVDNIKNRTQITSDTDQTGDTGYTGDKILKSLGANASSTLNNNNFPQELCKCNYCVAEFTTREDHLKHCVNNHPKKPAKPDRKWIETMKENGENVDAKGNSWE